MPRLTVRAAFEQLLELAGEKLDDDQHEVCCICRFGLEQASPHIDVGIAGGVFVFNVCGAACAYELGKRTMPAVELLCRPRALHAVPSDGVSVRGASSRPTRTSGLATGERRKNTTPARKAAKRRG